MVGCASTRSTATNGPHLGIICHFKAGQQLHITWCATGCDKASHSLRCGALYWLHTFSSLLRASCSSRWHAAESRPGRSATAAPRQVRSTSNFGTESAARAICVAVSMIGNSAGMIVLPLSPAPATESPRDKSRIKYPRSRDRRPGEYVLGLSVSLNRRMPAACDCRGSRLVQSQPVLCCWPHRTRALRETPRSLAVRKPRRQRCEDFAGGES